MILRFYREADGRAQIEVGGGWMGELLNAVPRRPGSLVLVELKNFFKKENVINIF